MDFTSGLNPEQRDAVLQSDGAVLILAGAGSGKTRVIAHRIAHIVSQGLAPADGILAVTFTNKAAEEMRSRVAALLKTDCSRMWISTFHSLCARLLRREAPAIGLSRDFVIYDSSDQLSVVKQALKALNIDDSLVQPRAALSRISHAKNTMQGPETFASGWNPRDKQIGQIYDFYRNALTESHALCSGRSSWWRSPSQSGRVTRGSSGTSWWTNTRTRTGRSTCWSSGSPSTTATSASSAILTSRSTSGVAQISGTSSTSRRTSRIRPLSASSAITARRRSSWTPRRR